MNENPYVIERTTVGIMCWNPTNEKFDMQYAGISIGFEPGQREILAIKCANHLLNAFGQRGLTSLSYGADEEKIKKDAIQRNHDFKTKQVVEYNQRNEARKQMKLGYLPPTEKLKAYAIELGLKLLEPYQVRDEERASISEAKTENETLKKQLADQGKQLAELQTTLNKFMEIKSRKFICGCGESFEYQTGLDNHKKSCKQR